MIEHETTMVYCTTSFEGFHQYHGAPADVQFLSFPHRHIFHVKYGVSVTHDNRDVEFILMKRDLNKVIERYQTVRGTDLGSCEMMAKAFIEMMAENKSGHFDYSKRLYFCEVSEDGENGAIVYSSEESK